MANKTIYDLKLHESVVIETTGDKFNQKFKVTRVASGWLYRNPSYTESIFVPFDNTFMKLDAKQVKE